MAITIDDQTARIEAAVLGALAGEEQAGSAAGAADLLGVAESVAATGGYDEADLRTRGLERPSRSGSAGLLLRALPFGLLSPLDRPRLRRDAYRCVALAGADEGTAITAVAAAMLIADLMRFDLATALLRVRQSLLEDAPMALLDRLAPLPGEEAIATSADPGVALQAAITAVDRGSTVREAIEAAKGGPSVGSGLAGALAGARDGTRALDGLDTAALPHGDRAVQIAHHLAERVTQPAAPAEPASPSG